MVHCAVLLIHSHHKTCLSGLAITTRASIYLPEDVQSAVAAAHLPRHISYALKCLKKKEGYVVFLHFSGCCEWKVPAVRGFSGEEPDFHCNAIHQYEE